MAFAHQALLPSSIHLSHEHWLLTSTFQTSPDVFSELHSLKHVVLSMDLYSR